MHRFFLLRHGRSRADDEQKYEGRYDSPLTETGRAQVRLVAPELRGRGIARIFTSALARARETADILAAELGLEIEESSLLLERDNGVLAGLGVQEAEGLYPEPAVVSRFWKFPRESGEAELELAARALLCLDFLVRKAPGAYLVVSHGNLLNALVRCALDIPLSAKVRFRFGDAGFLVMDYDEAKDSWTLWELRAGPSS